MASTVYAIGDVHGRADLLSSLVDFITEHARSNCIEPRVFFLGDIVDRGPDSREAMEIVCETLRRWPQSRLLLGNHDQLFLDAMTSQIYVEKWFAGFGGAKTLASYLGEGTHYWPHEITSIGERFPELLSVLGHAPTILPVGRYILFTPGSIHRSRSRSKIGMFFYRSARSSQITLDCYRILSCTVTLFRTHLSLS